MKQTITRAYRTELAPTPEQEIFLHSICRAVRFVYNAALEERIQAWRMQNARISAFDQMKELTTALNDPELNYLREAPRMALNASIQNLDRAYAAFFRRVKKGETPGFPRFKSRRGRSGFKFFTTVNVRRDEIRLPKIGWVKLAEPEYIPIGQYSIRSGAVTHYAGRWFVSVTVDQEIDIPEDNAGILVVHLGIRQLATLYDGNSFEVIPNPRHLRQYEKRLAILQQHFSNRTNGKTQGGKRGDREWVRLRDAIRKLHKEIADVRHDALHKLTTRIVSVRPAIVVLEDWDVRQMLEERAISKDISDASWGEIWRQLEYKALWNGVVIHKTERGFASSKTCSICKTVTEIRAEHIFACGTCGHTEDREQNSCRNLLQEAIDLQTLEPTI